MRKKLQKNVNLSKYHNLSDEQKIITPSYTNQLETTDIAGRPQEEMLTFLSLLTIFQNYDFCCLFNENIPFMVIFNVYCTKFPTYRRQELGSRREMRIFIKETF